MITLTIHEARRLVESAMIAVSHTTSDAKVIADHLIDCELRGLNYGGLARAIFIAEQIKAMSRQRRPIELLRESAISAQFDGGNQVGYLVARHATEIAISKAQSSGISAVGASKTWCTGMYSYYLEMVTKSGLVGMIAGSGGPFVAPFGGTDRKFCTNPIGFGFPSKGTPVIWDIGTSAIAHAEVLLSRRLGNPLPEGVAFDIDGSPTVDPGEALKGALAVWGGARGSGLALSIQLLGMLAGQINSEELLADCGFFILVIDPELFGGAEDFCNRVSAFVASVRKSRPMDSSIPVRIPFERSDADRKRRLANGTIEVEELIVETLRSVCSPNH